MDRTLFDKIKNVINNNLYILQIVWKISKLRFFIKAIITILSSVLPVVNILIIRYVIKTIEQDSTNILEVFSQVVVILVAYTILQFIAKTIDTVTSNYVDPILASKINKYMNEVFVDRVREFDYCCFEDPIFFDKYVRASKLVDVITHKVFSAFWGLCASFISIILLSSLIFSTDGIIIFFVLLSVIISFLQSLVSSKLNFEISQSLTPHARRQSYIKRLLVFPEYAKDIKFYDLLSTGKKYYSVEHTKSVMIMKQTGKKLTFANVIANSLSISSSSGLLIVLVYRILKGMYTIADFSALSTSATQLEGTLNSFLSCMANCYRNGLEIDNLRFIIDQNTKSKPKVDSPIKKDNGVCIEVKNLSFSYPNSNRLVLDDISFKVLPGEKISIVGLNGSGKTTLIKLMSGLYQPTAGEILLNGRSISIYSQEELRQIVGIAFQDNHIYAFSAKENISFEDDISSSGHHALKLMELNHFISSLPEGFDTILSKEYSDHGVNLSGGESQKICIARAINSGADILIFDEPSSSLDPPSEHNINSVLFGMQNKTVILVSHRLSTTMMADKILYIENGKLIEQGSHDSLMNANGAYAKLFSLQASNFSTSLKT